MTEHLLIGISILFVAGIGAQWLAWRVRIPAILLLLCFGFLLGPVSGLFNPDEVLGDLLHPFISMSVALILFEGGLSLKIAELRGHGHVVRNLVSVGTVVTWVIGTLGAHYLVGLDFSLSLLLGAVLVVSGPTVIIPLLRSVRPMGHIGPILKWEGIIIDPIGVTLAVLVFEGIVSGGFLEASVVSIVKTIIVGGLGGAAGAYAMMALLKRYWIPDYLQNPVALMFVFVIFSLSDFFMAESGLLAVTLMGFILANQEKVAIRHIVEFKENLRVLLIGILFIILASRLRLTDMTYISLPAIGFLALLIVVARPVAVFLSTIGSGLKAKERFFLMCMAPRGIVAAAIISVFSIRLMDLGYEQAQLLAPLTFMVIIGTVGIYGLAAGPIAAKLGLATPNPQGVFIAGAHEWARAMATTLMNEGFLVQLADNNRVNVAQARLEGIPAYHGNVLSEALPMAIELGGMGRFFAMTYNDNVNSLAVIHFADIFGRNRVYQLAPLDEKKVSQTMRGRLLFDKEVTYPVISERFRKGAVIKCTHLTEEFDFEEFKAFHRTNAIPLFRINEKKELSVFTPDSPIEPKPGETIISLVNPVEDPHKVSTKKA